MFMIVILHSGSHGRTLSIAEGLNYYSIVFHFIEALTICSVNVFVLISGFFLCTQDFKLSRILKLLFAVLFYSVGWFIVYVFVFDNPFSIKDFIRALFPVSYTQYWFISTYIGLCLLSPILNHVIKHFTRAQHLGTIILLVAIFSIWPDIFVLSNPMGVTERGCTVAWFIVLYFIAAYIRKWPINLKPYRAFLLYTGCAIILLFVWIVLVLLTSTNNFEDEIHGMFTFYYYRYNSFIVLLTSAFLFLLFLNLTVNNVILKKIIMFVAPLTMGVYLIHDNIHARKYVWSGLFNLEPTIAAPLIVLGYALLVFCACIVIDWLRTILFSAVNKRHWYKELMLKLDGVPKKIKLVIENHFLI